MDIITIDVGNIHGRIRHGKKAGTSYGGILSEIDDYCYFRGHVKYDGLREVKQLVKDIRVIRNGEKNLLKIDLDRKKQDVEKARKKYEQKLTRIKEDLKQQEESLRKQEQFYADEMACRRDPMEMKKIRD